VTDIALELDTPLGSAYSIGGDKQLNYREDGASSVPKSFTYDHTTHRMGLMHVTCYVQKVQQFSQCLVTGAETSIMRHLKLKKKIQASITWNIEVDVETKESTRKTEEN